MRIDLKYVQRLDLTFVGDMKLVVSWSSGLEKAGD